MENDETANVEAAQNPTSETLSESDLIAQLSQGTTEQPTEETEAQPDEAEETEETETEDTEEEEAEAESEAEETEEEEAELEAEAEAAGIDLDSLTEDQWEAVRKQLKSKAAARIGTLTAKLKAAEEEANRLRQQQPQQPEPDPVESRFLKGVANPEELAAKAKELKALAKDTDRILLQHEDYGPDDEIQLGDKTFTKKQLRALNMEIREALDEAVPYQAHKFQKAEQIKAQSEAFKKQLAEVKELEDKDSEVAKQFQNLSDAPMFQEPEKHLDELKAAMPYILAHFARSKFGGTATPKKPTQPAKPTRTTPPSTPANSAAPGPAKPKKVAKERFNQFESTGSQEDLIAAMAAQHS